MGKTHVEIVVFNGIEKAPEFLIGAFNVVEEFVHLKDDDEAGYYGSHVLFIEENKVHKSGYRKKEHDNANEDENAEAVKAHISPIYGIAMNG